MARRGISTAGMTAATPMTSAHQKLPEKAWATAPAACAPCAAASASVPSALPGSRTAAARLQDDRQQGGAQRAGDAEGDVAGGRRGRDRGLARSWYSAAISDGIIRPWPSPTTNSAAASTARVVGVERGVDQRAGQHERGSRQRRAPREPRRSVSRPATGIVSIAPRPSGASSSPACSGLRRAHLEVQRQQDEQPEQRARVEEQRRDRVLKVRSRNSRRSTRARSPRRSACRTNGRGSTTPATTPSALGAGQPDPLPASASP